MTSSPEAVGEERYGSGEQSFTYDEYLYYVQGQAMFYLDSYPGPDAYPCNFGLHLFLRGIIERGSRPDIWRLHSYLNVVNRRIKIMEIVTMYKNRLGINFPDCHAVNNDEFRYPGPNEPNRPGCDEIHELICGYSLFNDSSVRFWKAHIYLVNCIIHAGWTVAEAKSKLDQLFKRSGKDLRGSITEFMRLIYW